MATEERKTYCRICESLCGLVATVEDGELTKLRPNADHTPGSQDTASRSAASAFLYGSTLQFPIPDLERTDFLLMLGANPFVSHGSLVAAPRIKDTLKEIPRRGGRVVVVDPRRTETAQAFEHVQVRPDSDA
jgi:formate dehydrogenase